MTSFGAVSDVARCVLCQAGMRVPAKGLPLFASVVGVVAPLVAVSGLVPPMAGPVLLVLGMMAALALARGGTGGGR